MKKLLLSAFLLTSISFAQGSSEEEENVVLVANTYYMASNMCNSSSVSEEESAMACSAKNKLETIFEELPSATYDLAMVYFQGRSEAGEDYKLAKYWMEKSAELGNREAQKTLAVFYFMGKGTKQDVNKGVFWAERASEQGDQDANMFLGGLYYEGKLTNKDLDKAKLYYGKMCDAGEQVGCDFYKKANEEYLRQKNKE